MRTISTTNERRLAAGLWRAKVEVQDAGGTWRDLSTLPTFNALKSATWGEDADAPGLTADLTFFRNLDAISLSPLHAGSPLNRSTPFDPGGSFSALVTPHRRVRISWALLGDAGETPTWAIAFDGVINRIDLTDDELIGVECRGQYAELQDRIFEEEFVFAFGSATSQTGPWRVWQPSTAYAVGDKVLPTDGKANGKWYTCTTAGTSGTSEPTWPASSTVSDGSAVHTYGNTTSPTGGYAVEQVIEELALSVIPATTARFGDPSSPTTIDVYVPSSPGWAINVFQVRRENVWNEMRALADQIGWDLRWKWSNASSAFRLTLYDPNRSKTTADRTFAFGDGGVRGYESLAVDLANIRNAVGVVFSDASDLDAQSRPRRKKVVRTDSTSIATYGRRYMELGEASASNVDSTSEANALGDAVLSDLALPVADLGVRLAFFPFVELTDLYELPPDGRRFTAAQKLAVVGYRHTVEGDSFATSLEVRGKPATGFMRWVGQSAAADPRDAHRLLQKGVAGAPATTATADHRGVDVRVSEASPLPRAFERALEVHVSTSSGFTPSSSTLRALSKGSQAVVKGLKPGQTNYIKTIPFSYNSERIVQGMPSEQTSVVPAYVEPVDLNPETVPALLPPNGGFEGWFDGDTSPPDHWSAGTGAWATDMARITDRAGGAYAVEWKDTGSSVRAELVSAWFPVSPGRTYSIDAMVKKAGSTDGDVRLTLEWGDTSKASTGSALQFTQSTNGLSAWTKTRTLVADAPSGAVWARAKVGRDVSGTYRFGVDEVVVRDVGEAVRAPSYGTNWADYGGGFTGAGYWKDTTGRVHLRGLAQTAAVRAAGAVIFTLPSGFRPAAQEVFAGTTGGAGGFGRVDVAANGDVIVQFAMAINDWVSLAGISFDTR